MPDIVHEAIRTADKVAGRVVVQKEVFRTIELLDVLAAGIIIMVIFGTIVDIWVLDEAHISDMGMTVCDRLKLRRECTLRETVSAMDQSYRLVRSISD